MLPPPGFQTSTLASILDNVAVASTSLFPSTSSVALTTSDLFEIATINPTPTLFPTLVSVATTTLVAAMSTTTPSPFTSSSSKPSSDDENTGECQLLGPFAILIQAALGGLALLSLVFKRWRERPQRPIKVWSFDVSKQVVGSILLHLANLVMSMFSAGQISTTAVIKAAKYQPNPCSFYLLNLAIDTTIGIPILIVLLRLYHAAFRLTPLANPPESIQSGNYGQPPRYAWWAKQSLIYFLGLLSMKACVLVLFQLLPWIVKVGDWALRWTEGNEALQIAFVMLIFPLIMNALQYYIIDTFIKKQERSEPSKEADEEGAEGARRDSDDSAGEHGGLLAGHERAEVVDIDEEDEARKKNAKVTTRKVASPGGSGLKSPPSGKQDLPSGREEYNPDEDGETAGDSHTGTEVADHPAHEEDKDLLSKIPKPTE